MVKSGVLYSEVELAAKRAIVKAADELLMQRVGDPAPKRKDAVYELILTVLSQNTSDHNRDIAFGNLRERFPEWELVRKAKAEEIEEAIRPGGLAKQKSRNILSILDWVKEQSGGYDLNWLGKIPLPEALDKLTALPGVGIKTASVVMCFSFGAPVFPVDVHIHRICRRWGLSPAKGTAETTHYLMQPLIPEGRWKQLHLNMLKLGRIICRPAKPNCPDCPVKGICEFYRKSASR